MNKRLTRDIHQIKIGFENVIYSEEDCIIKVPYNEKEIKIILHENWPFVNPIFEYDSKQYSAIKCYNPQTKLLLILNDFITQFGTDLFNFKLVHNLKIEAPDIIINVKFYFIEEPLKLCLRNGTKYSQVIDLIKTNFAGQLDGYHLDTCIISGINLKNPPTDRDLYDGATIYVITWDIMKENKMVDFLKQSCTTLIDKLKIVSTPHSGFSPRIIIWHYINFPKWDWNKILDMTFGQSGVKMHLHKNIIKGERAQIPFIFYHQEYLEIFYTYLNRHINNFKNSTDILDMLVEVVPLENITNTTIINVLFGDIIGTSEYNPQQNKLDENVLCAYNEYIDFIMDM